MALLDLWSW